MLLAASALAGCTSPHGSLPAAFTTRAARPTGGSRREDPPLSEPGSGDSRLVVLGEPEPIAFDDGQVRAAQVVTETATPVHVPCAEAADTWWQQDRAEFLEMLRQDVESIFTCRNAITLSVAAGASFAIHETLDDDIAENTAKNPNRWGKVQDVIGGIGNPLHHLAAASGLYAYSLLTNDEDTHELSKTLFDAVAITAVSTTFLKYLANTERPNGDSHGWPSGHTASSMAFAAVLDEYYGCRVGIPAYILAGLVAWERIDDREHDLADVVFGAALGYVIGHSVAARHRSLVGGFEVQPFVDPASGATGVGLERSF
jgi:hypothetical protein